MKFKSICLFALFIISAGFLFSCTSDSSPDEKNAVITLKLVDAEGDYDKVLVKIVDVQYNRNDDDQGWTSFEGFTTPETSDPEGRVDLCELIAGNSLVLTEEEIESGMMSHIRLILGEGNALVLEGETEEIELNTPSAQQSGLKLHLGTELEPGFSYVFILDWDVQRSIVKAGNSGNYNLKPVIRIKAEATSGSLSGRIADDTETDENKIPLEGAVVTLYEESDVNEENPISTTTDDSGIFVLQGLPEGNYNLFVSMTGYAELGPLGPYSITIGNVNNTGTILMTVTP